MMDKECFFFPPTLLLSSGGKLWPLLRILSAAGVSLLHTPVCGCNIPIIPLKSNHGDNPIRAGNAACSDRGRREIAPQGCHTVQAPEKREGKETAFNDDDEKKCFDRLK